MMTTKSQVCYVIEVCAAMFSGLPVDLTVTFLSVPEILGSITGPVKSDTVSPTAEHRCDVTPELCWPGAKPWR